MYQKRKEKRNEKRNQRNKKKKSEEDYQRKGMSLVALLKTRVFYVLIIYLLFTGGWRIEKTTAKNDNLTRSFVWKKR